VRTALQSPERFGVTFERNVPTPMRDGTVLAADVYLPQCEGEHPVLLQRTPYDKTLPAIGLMADPLRLAGAGYAVVVQDTRGRWSSDGEFRLFQDEIQDGFDAVEWCAAQPWSNGRVGMFGVSYVAMTQWFAALARPPHLVTIMPALSASNAHNGWTYRGGAFELGFNLSLTLLYFALETAAKAAAAGTAPRERISELVAAIDDLPGCFARLPLRDQPALAEVAPYYFDWLDHPEDDEYWRPWKIEDSYGGLELPALHIGGWYDIFLDGTIRNFAGMRSEGGSADARRGQKLVVGPWSHGLPWLANPVGEVDFGLASTGVAAELEALQLRWCDYWLKGIDDGVLDEPPVRIFVMGANVWRDEHEWPLARTSWEDYFFRSGGRANSRDGDGLIALEPPGAEPSDSYTFDPRDPVPTRGGGLCCSPGYNRGGAFDQRCVEERQDVLVYTTSPLVEDLEVTGPVGVTLWASTSGRDTDWTAKLVDVAPDGFARNLTDGIIRARYRHSFTEPALLEPDLMYRYEIDLAATSNLFKVGHRIRVEISSSHFPRFDRNSNTGGRVSDEPELRRVVQRVYHDDAHPSRITLPVIR
jgi:putative CocE/NonD family hydrolase